MLDDLGDSGSWVDFSNYGFGGDADPWLKARNQVLTDAVDALDDAERSLTEDQFQQVCCRRFLRSQ